MLSKEIMLDVESAIEFIPQLARGSTKIIVGLSGGVDSSVTAYLLKAAGLRVEGLFMKNWDEDDGTEYCTAKQDLEDAEQVCQKIGIHLHTANFASEYWDQVFEYFLKEYKAGRTPNPDVLCNREIKFKVFLDYAKLLGADYIATGHYSQITRSSGNTYLLKGVDPNKDQSYFLHALETQQLSQAIFPLGRLHKPQIRAIAEKIGLQNAAKKDSTGICFIGERRLKTFLQEYLPAKPGTIETLSCEVIGQHEGLMYYTLGQRQGLGIGGLANADESPWYVAHKDLSHNRLIVVQGKDHPTLFQSSLQTEAIHWINQPRAVGWSGYAKCRYRQQNQACKLIALVDNRATFEFEQAQRSVTPGQYLVLYEDDLCLGGAIISSTPSMNHPELADSPNNQQKARSSRSCQE